HELRSSWRTDNYLDCHCSGIECCTSYMTPVNYDKEKCVRIFMKETCVYKVVEKNDHSKECPVRERVG
ncbi:Beta-microseminoprotein, partial [Leptosomus discolor]